MKKYECRCNKGKEHHCTHESDGRKPTICCVAGDGSCDWQEVENPESLPKLTAEALAKRGIEWPEQAICAVVTDEGTGLFCKKKPMLSDDEEYWMARVVDWNCALIPGTWDASDWRNSLIYRKIGMEGIIDFAGIRAKVGDWIHHKGWGFARIVAICGDHQSVEVHYLSGGTGMPIISNCKPVRVRPWTDETVPAVPFGVRRKDVTWQKTTVLSNDSSAVHVYGREYAVTYSTLMEEYELLDGSPCGVLEIVE